MGSRTRKAAPARPENTEGVGESRGYESASGILLRRGAEVFRRLFFTIPSERRPVKLEPLSRRRPLSSTGTGAVCNELHGVGRYLAAAGPCDAVTDIRAMSKTVKWRLPTSSSGASSSSRPS